MGAFSATETPMTIACAAEERPQHLPTQQICLHALEDSTLIHHHCRPDFGLKPEILFNHFAIRIDIRWPKTGNCTVGNDSIVERSWHRGIPNCGINTTLRDRNWCKCRPERMSPSNLRTTFLPPSGRLNGSSSEESSIILVSPCPKLANTPSGSSSVSSRLGPRLEASPTRTPRNPNRENNNASDLLIMSTV